ncbi:MAG TPA: ABC transporter permease, partial [Micropruina sp.]|nr:ABC transporter permease [Micropruina sp.]
MRILAFLGRRLGIFALSLLGASLLVFAVCAALPGEVAAIILGEGATPEQITKLTAQLGLDRPWLVRYADWVGGMLHGDFGTSYFTGQNVLQLMSPRIAVTLWLVLFSLVLSVVIAVPVGMLAAMK